MCIRDRPYDVKAVYLPGGLPGATNLAEHPLVLHIVQSLAVDEKLIVAVCAGPYVLYAAGLSKDLKMTCAPIFKDKIPNCDYITDCMVVQEKNFLTGVGPAACLPLALQALTVLKGEEVSQQVAAAMQVSKLYATVKQGTCVQKFN